MDKRCCHFFANHVRFTVSCAYGYCPATLAAVDRVADAVGNQVQNMRYDLGNMLEVLAGASYTHCDLRSLVTTPRLTRDIELATGRTPDWWVRVIDACPR